MPSARFQPSFAAGVLGPGLHGRIDIAKYDVGLKVGLNVFVHPHGGVSNRAGLEFVAEVLDSNLKHRLISFTRDDDENYIMVMGNLNMQIIENGAVVQDGAGDYVAASSFTSDHVMELDYVQSIDVMYFAHKFHFPKIMSRAGATSWTFANLPIDPVVPAPTGVGVAPSSMGTESFSYVVSATVDGVEGFPSAAGSTNVGGNLNLEGNENVISWTGSADDFNVYRERNGIYGFIGFTTENTFTDDNISADLTITPVVDSGIFDGAGNWPSRVTLFQQRLIFGGSRNQPETVWASRIGDFSNFTRSRILRDDDRIELDLSGQQINRIKSMLQLRELLVFSSSGEFSITGPNGVMTATNPVQTQYGYSGASNVKPLVVEDTALFVDRTGRSVRDLRYAFEQDGYSGNDLSIFASHFFEGRTIADWAYAKNPFSVIWVCLDDGKLLSLTYKREHQVWAWCEHEVGGEVESIAAIPEGTEDSVYMVVKRQINGQTKRYIERMRSRMFDDGSDAFFVDSGLTYDGAPTSTLTGLDHLEGETLMALGDGNVMQNLVVSGGSVDLPREVSKIHIGLYHPSEVENLPPAIDLQDVGSARGRPHNIGKLFLQLEKTRGISVSTATRKRFTELLSTSGDLAQEIDLFTGMADVSVHPDWNRDGTVVLRQPYPLPMTVLGISPELVVGRAG